jgi:hypothetical protein
MQTRRGCDVVTIDEREGPTRRKVPQEGGGGDEDQRGRCDLADQRGTRARRG